MQISRGFLTFVVKNVMVYVRLCDFTGVFASFWCEIWGFRCLCENTGVFDMFSNNFRPNFGWGYGAGAFRREIHLHSASLPLHDFRYHFHDFDVYLISPRFLICFQRISKGFSVEIMALMRFAGKLTSILHRSPRAICFPQCTHAAVYAISPRFSWCFHNMFAQFSLQIRTDVRFAGDFACIWPRGPGTFPSRIACLWCFTGQKAASRKSGKADSGTALARFARARFLC